MRNRRCKPTLLRLGDAYVAPPFSLRPSDLIEFAEHQRWAGLEAGAPLRTDGGPAPGADLAVPAQLLVARATAELARAADLPAMRRRVGSVRSLGAVVIGEALVVTATVLYVTSRGTERHATLAVRVHRRGGHVVLSFELGVALQEIESWPARHVRDQLRAA